jgi:hypothetical protein
VVRRPVARSGKATPNLVSLLAGPVSLRSSGCRHVLCRGRMRDRWLRCMEPLWRRAVILDLISFPRPASVCGRPEGSCAMPEGGRIICRTLRWRKARPNARTRTPTTRPGVTVLFAYSYDWRVALHQSDSDGLEWCSLWPVTVLSTSRYFISEVRNVCPLGSSSGGGEVGDDTR